MLTRFALRVPEQTPFLAAPHVLVLAVAVVLVPQRVAHAASVRRRLEAEGAVVTEVGRTILPANRTHPWF